MFGKSDNREGQRNNNGAGDFRSRNSGKSRNDRGGKSYNRTRTVRFNVNVSNERTKSAVQDIIQKVHGFSPSYKINFVDSATNKISQKNLADIVNGVDFRQDGLHLIEPKDETELPIIKLVDVQEMNEVYSDKLAALKEQELLKLGSASAQRTANKKLQAEKKKSATKILTISWAISVSDLMNQKKNEILKRVNKGEKFVIFVGEKASLYNARSSADSENSVLKNLDQSRTKWDRMDEDELSLEMKKREMIFEKLHGILEEIPCKFDVSGSHDARMMVNVVPNSTTSSESAEESEETLSPREQKRARQKNRAKETKKTQEEDLDSLYLFKIED